MNKYKWWLWALLSVILVLVFYRQIPTAHFNWEDTMFLGDAAKVWTTGNLKHTFTPWIKKYVRYFRQPFFVIFYKLFGYQAAPYFTFILILRLLNVFLVYLLAYKLTGLNFVSLFSSLFYGFYQINFQELMWLSSGTKEEPMVTFFLLMLIAFIRYLEKRKTIFLFFSLLAFFICFHCEFKAFSVPLVLLAYEFIFKMDKKKFFKFSWLLKYFPFLLVELYFFRFVYNDSSGMFSGFKDWQFVWAFPASLTLYFFEVERLSIWTWATKNWGFNPLPTDGIFLTYFGSAILLVILGSIIFFALKKESRKALIILFLLLGTFICYLPVILMVYTGKYSLERVTVVHWRYLCLSSSLACLMVVLVVYWGIEAVLRCLRLFLSARDKVDQELKLALKYPVVQAACLLALLLPHLRMDKRMLNEFLYSSRQAKKFFTSLKISYPEFSKETVLAIEGAESDGSPNFFQNRYLLENIFALYAKPNNPNYLEEQRAMPFDGEEAFNRKQKTLLYYANLKYFIVGNHQFMYDPNNNVSWSKPNLPWILSTYDREFLGAIYGFFDPQKYVVLSLSNKLDEYGLFSDLTENRRVQLQKFLAYYCFKDGRKNCRNQALPTSSKGEIIKVIYSAFSEKGKEIIDYLVSRPVGPLPDLFTLKI